MSYNECPEEYEGYEIEPTQQKPTVGFLIDQLAALRDTKRNLEKRLKEIEAEYTNIEIQLLEAFDAIGTFSSKTTQASATISEQTIVTMVDRDAFWTYVFETRDSSLVSYARPASKACQELATLGIVVPGTETLKKRGISLRSN